MIREKMVLTHRWTVYEISMIIDGIRDSLGAQPGRFVQCSSYETLFSLKPVCNVFIQRLNFKSNLV